MLEACSCRSTCVVSVAVVVFLARSFLAAAKGSFTEGSSGRARGAGLNMCAIVASWQFCVSACACGGRCWLCRVRRSFLCVVVHAQLAHVFTRIELNALACTFACAAQVAPVAIAHIFRPSPFAWRITRCSSHPCSSTCCQLSNGCAVQARGARHSAVLTTCAVHPCGVVSRGCAMRCVVLCCAALRHCVNAHPVTNAQGAVSRQCCANAVHGTWYTAHRAQCTVRDEAMRLCSVVVRCW